MNEEHRLYIKDIIDAACNNLLNGNTNLELLDPFSIEDEKIAIEMLNARDDIKYYISEDVVPQIFIKLKLNKQLNDEHYNASYIRFEQYYGSGDFEHAVQEIKRLIPNLKRNNYHMSMYNKFGNVYRSLGYIEEANKYQILCISLFKDFMKKKGLEDFFNLFYNEYRALVYEDAFLGFINYDKEINIKYLYRMASIMHFKFYIVGSIIIIERYKSKNLNNNVYKYKEEVQYYFHKRDYLKLIETIGYLLRIDRINRGQYYLYLAVAYKNLGKIDLAIRMLEASKIFNYLNGDTKNTSNLNEMIREFVSINIEENGAYYEMELDLVINDKLINIARLINEDDTLIDNFNLNNEEKVIVYLLLARECYHNSNYILGNKYIKKAEKISPKTKRACDLIKEVEVNKRLYKNHCNDKRLVLR